jgi:hypothetical protein
MFFGRRSVSYAVELVGHVQPGSDFLHLLPNLFIDEDSISTPRE